MQCRHLRQHLWEDYGTLYRWASILNHLSCSGCVYHNASLSSVPWGELWFLRHLPWFLSDFSIPLRPSIQILTILTFRRYRKVHHEMAPDTNQDRWQAKAGWAKIHLQSVDNTRDRRNIYKNIIIFRCQIWLACLSDFIKWYSKAQCSSSDESTIQRTYLVLKKK